jgi:hypothetical protein
MYTLVSMTAQTGSRDLDAVRFQAGTTPRHEARTTLSILTTRSIASRTASAFGVDIGHWHGFWHVDAEYATLELP